MSQHPTTYDELDEQFDTYEALAQAYPTYDEVDTPRPIRDAPTTDPSTITGTVE